MDGQSAPGMSSPSVSPKVLPVKALLADAWPLSSFFLSHTDPTSCESLSPIDLGDR
jgi:hypothetical protein